MLGSEVTAPCLKKPKREEPELRLEIDSSQHTKVGLGVELWPVEAAHSHHTWGVS